jgi:hypothetical protein
MDLLARRGSRRVVPPPSGDGVDLENVTKKRQADQRDAAFPSTTSSVPFGSRKGSSMSKLATLGTDRNRNRGSTGLLVDYFRYIFDSYLYCTCVPAVLVCYDDCRDR